MRVTSLLDIEDLLHLLGHFVGIHKQTLTLLGKEIVEVHHDDRIDRAILQMIDKIRKKRVKRHNDMRFFLSRIRFKIMFKIQEVDIIADRVQEIDSKKAALCSRY